MMKPRIVTLLALMNRAVPKPASNGRRPMRPPVAVDPLMVVGRLIAGSAEKMVITHGGKLQSTRLPENWMVCGVAALALAAVIASRNEQSAPQVPSFVSAALVTV